MADAAGHSQFWFVPQAYVDHVGEDAVAGHFDVVQQPAYDDYVYRVQSEIDQGLRDEAARHPYARVYPIGAISRGFGGEELILVPCVNSDTAWVASLGDLCAANLPNP